MNQNCMLYVEDNPLDVLLLQSGFKLRNMPFEFELVNDGEEAIIFLTERNPKPNFILLDLNLPRKNGFEVLQEIKSSPSLSFIQIVIYSGSANKNDAQKCLTMGAREFIEKPSDIEGILKVVDRLTILIQENGC
jgi:chemotaxis family two-component system response regulator Rcp1